MQKIAFTLVFCFFIPFLIFGQSAEEAAIKNLCVAETTAFCKMSISDVVKTYWIVDDKTIMNVSMPDGTHIQLSGADALNDTNVPPENHATFKNSEYKFSIYGDIAVVTYTQEVTLAEGGRVNSHEMRVVEKVNGEWKLHISSVHQFVPRD